MALPRWRPADYKTGAAGVRARHDSAIVQAGIWRKRLMQAGRELPVIVVTDDDPAHRLLTVKAFERSCLRNPIKQVQDGEELLDYLLGSGAYAGTPPSPPMIILLDL